MGGCKKVENGGVCREVENAGCFVKKWKMGGVFLVKKWEKGVFCKNVDLSSMQGALYSISILYFIFYLFGRGCVRGPALTLSLQGRIQLLGGLGPPYIRPSFTPGLKTHLFANPSYANF